VLDNRSVHRAWWVVSLAGLAGCDLLLGLSTINAPPDGPPPVRTWTSVAGAVWHTCAIKGDQHLWCWGRNETKQIDPTSPAIELDTPTQVGTDTWSSISASYFHTCGIRTDQSLWCWGEDGSGQLGDGNANQLPSSAMVNVAGKWNAVATGLYHTCAIDTTARRSSPNSPIRTPSVV